MSIESVQPWATRPGGECMGKRSALVVVGYSMKRLGGGHFGLKECGLLSLLHCQQSCQSDKYLQICLGNEKPSPRLRANWVLVCIRI